MAEPPKLESPLAPFAGRKGRAAEPPTPEQTIARRADRLEEMRQRIFVDPQRRETWIAREEGRIFAERARLGLAYNPPIPGGRMSDTSIRREATRRVQGRQQQRAKRIVNARNNMLKALPGHQAKEAAAKADAPPARAERPTSVAAWLDDPKAQKSALRDALNAAAKGEKKGYGPKP